MTNSTTTHKRPHHVDVAVGKRLKELRTMRRMSQSDVACKLGLSFQQIQKYETGTNRISSSRLYEMSNILGVCVADLFSEVGQVAKQHVYDGGDSLVLSMANKVLKTKNPKVRAAFEKKLSALVDTL